MNILMLCSKFSIDENDAWLTNELAQSFCEKGHHVQVVCIDWSAKNGSSKKYFSTSAGVNAVVLPPVALTKFGNFIAKASKWIFSSVSARKEVDKIISKKKFDLIIAFSPAVTMMAPILTSFSSKKCKSYLIVWDFFPYHHQQIGLIRSKYVFFLAKKIEEHLVRKFDFIGCMTEKNVEYLQNKYKLRNTQKVNVLPLWANADPVPEIDKHLVRTEFGLPQDKIIAIFGGQLEVGRGIEEILSVANIARINQDEVLFLFVGSGSHETLIQQSIDNGSKNVALLRKIPRNKYLRLLSACDIALVCTVGGVDVPTFPSKTLDYFKASLPIVASVEPSTDYGELIEKWQAGFSSAAGDVNTFYENIKILSLDADARHVRGKNGNDYFYREMRVSKISNNLLKSIAN